MTASFPFCWTDGMTPEIPPEVSVALALRENPANLRPAAKEGGSTGLTDTALAVAAGKQLDADQPFLPELVVWTDKLWLPGRQLRVSFVDGTPPQQAKVKRFVAAWQIDALPIRFVDSYGQIRISFGPRGPFSRVGTDAKAVPDDQATLFLGGQVSSDPTDTVIEQWVVRHEFGHALGCEHEHQSPLSPILWNTDVVYRDCWNQQRWDQAKVQEQILNKMDKTQTQYTAYDPKSVMNYLIPKDWTLNNPPYGVSRNPQPSATDLDFIRKSYAVDTGATIVDLWHTHVEPGWYQPTTDTDSWKQFAAAVWDIDYRTASGDTLKAIAYASSTITSGADEGMWEDRASKVNAFLDAALAVSDYTPGGFFALQIEFIACFLSPYQHAAHNEDLWQTINDVASGVLAAAATEPVSVPAAAVDPEWIDAEVATALYCAYPGIYPGRYAPTVDTDTWAQFQNIVWSESDLTRFPNIVRAAYRLSKLSSPADSGTWGAVANRASAFCARYIGKSPTTPADQKAMAIQYCQIIASIDPQHAAHNNDLFKTYSDAFKTASSNLSRLG